MNQSIRRKAWTLLVLGPALALLASACNTVEGAGKDIESAGDAVKDEAREHH